MMSAREKRQLIRFEMRSRTMSKRVFSRPRTKVYDSNYSLGEAYYKSALDSLDEKSYGSRRQPLTRETIECPQAPARPRPSSAGDFESLVAKASAENELDEETLATLQRIRKARSAAAATAEEGFESAFHSRRDEVKKRFSEKILDSVGINEVSDIDSNAAARKRQSRYVLEEVPTLHYAGLRSVGEEAVDAASVRALRSRARLSDLQSEMDDLMERGAARERRAATLRQMVDEEAANSMRFASKKITMTSTTEKRTY